tara:strand:+ start:50034 stop:51173 length:1140 start_codon:yes stop_codon:yes gene_type:complete
MKIIQRALENVLINSIQDNKVLVLVGARRVGKTELVKKVVSKLNKPALVLNGEDEDTHDLLKQKSARNYQKLMGSIQLLVIDEAQAIPNIGAKLKLMVDSIDGIQIIATGSSVFDLNNQLGEPLVGRKKTFMLYPLAQMEFKAEENYVETTSKFQERLIFGGYPELEQFDNWDDKQQYLKEQVSSYLLKDILAFEGIRKRDKIVSLLRMLAFRAGSEISLEGIGRDLQMSKATVDRYLDLLTKVFIIHKVSGFSRNLDNEITKISKWFFYDNGIRNALINNFNPMNLRNDQGILFESYVLSERLKFQEYTRIHSSNYFWRTHTKQEIDWIEDRGGQLYGYEVKWNLKKKVKIPPLWKKAYPQAEFKVISPDNYLDFIGG